MRPWRDAKCFGEYTTGSYVGSGYKSKTCGLRKGRVFVPRKKNFKSKTALKLAPVSVLSAGSEEANTTMS
jgi:hypothetical protein